MNTDGIVSILVGVLRVHTLGDRSKCIGEASVLLHLSALLSGELAVAGDVLERLVDVYVAGCLIEQRAAGIELGLHTRKHVVHSGEVYYLLAKLGTLLGIR